MNNILWVFVKDVLFYPFLPKNVRDLKNKVRNVIADATDDSLHQSGKIFSINEVFVLQKLVAALNSCSCCNLM
jgi:transcriptional regulator with AAA-type ATPase domain